MGTFLGGRRNPRLGKWGGRKDIDQVRSIWTSMGESRSQSAYSKTWTWNPMTRNCDWWVREFLTSQSYHLPIPFESKSKRSRRLRDNMEREREREGRRWGDWDWTWRGAMIGMNCDWSREAVEMKFFARMCGWEKANGCCPGCPCGFGGKLSPETRNGGNCEFLFKI